MKNTKPPFEINERIIADTIEIAELVGIASINSKISSNPILQRTKRGNPSFCVNLRLALK